MTALDPPFDYLVFEVDRDECLELIQTDHLLTIPELQKLVDEQAEKRGRLCEVFGPPVDNYL